MASAGAMMAIQLLQYHTAGPPELVSPCLHDILFCGCCYCYVHMRLFLQQLPQTISRLANRCPVQEPR